MTNLRISALFGATLIVIAAKSISVDAQTAMGAKPSVTNQSATISLSIAVPIEHIPAGQKPWVSLTVKNLSAAKNLSNEGIAYPRDRVYVEGPKGEPPTTLRQRQLTMRLKPGEPQLRTGGFEPLIAPGASFTRKYDLSSLYDFKEPGEYTVYIEVLDESAPETKSGAGLWVRSPVATFEVQAPTR
ncbi:MAG: hypothetical protein WB919_17815 [Candidatus Sulfotelmatobacter sp.]